MHHGNPACYECPKVGSGIHTWIKRDDGTSYCLKCDTELTVEQTNDVWNIHPIVRREPIAKIIDQPS